MAKLKEVEQVALQRGRARAIMRHVVAYRKHDDCVLASYGTE